MDFGDCFMVVSRLDMSFHFQIHYNNKNYFHIGLGKKDSLQYINFEKIIGPAIRMI